MFSEMGKALALTAKEFSFRPSEAVGLENTSEKLLFDMTAALALLEAQRDVSSYPDNRLTRPLSYQHEQKIAERIRAQELESKTPPRKRGI